MSAPTWSLADTHCVWCGKPKVTDVEWDRHRDHHCAPEEDTCWCLGWCWSCEQSRFRPPEVVAELRGLVEAQGAVIDAAAALLASMDGYAVCRGCGVWINRQAHKPDCLTETLRAALASARIPTTLTEETDRG